MITIKIPTSVEIDYDCNKIYGEEGFINNSIDYVISVPEGATVYEFVDMIATAMRQYGYMDSVIRNGFKNYITVTEAQEA